MTVDTENKRRSIILRVADYMKNEILLAGDKI
jgi:hypothetical protein